MAIIDNNQGEYYKIIENECYATKDGFYISVAVYNSKEDRDKEKDRDLKIRQFLMNVHNFFREVEENSDSERPEDYELLILLMEQFEFRTHYIPGREEILDQLPDIPSDVIKIAEKYGFEKIWFDDPINIRTEYTTWSKEYEGDSFEMENMYDILKKHEMGRSGGEITEFIDDL